MSSSFKHACVIAVAAFAIGLPVVSHAAVAVFTDKGAFVLNTDPIRATGTIPDLGVVAQPFDLGSVRLSTVATGGLHIGAASTTPTGDWTIFNPGNDIAISGVENLDVELTSLTPVYAVGFDFVEPARISECFAPCFDSTFEITVNGEGVVLGTFLFNAPNDTLAFWGVWSDAPITTLEIRDATGTIDDELWGEFYTSDKPF